MTTRIFTLSSRRETAGESETVTFSLRELLPDDDGAVVIGDQAGTDVTVLTDDAPNERGIERDHVTRNGCDVSGLAYCRFAGGITLYYPRSHALCEIENDDAD